MTNIPQVNEWQITVLTDLASIAPTLLLVEPHEDDPPEQRSLREQRNKDANQLLELGLIEDANKDGMFDTYIQSVKPHLGGRACRIFKITEMGFTLFVATKEKVTIH